MSGCLADEDGGWRKETRGDGDLRRGWMMWGRKVLGCHGWIEKE